MGAEGDALSVSAWTVPQVVEWLEQHHFPQDVVDSFRSNAVNGSDLFSLTDEDMRQHLELKPLLVRKLRTELTQLGVPPPPGQPAPAGPAGPVTSVTPATPATPAAPVPAPSVPAVPVAAAAPRAAPSAGGTFAPADLERYRDLQKSIAELQALQIPSKLSAAQHYAASTQQQHAAAQGALPPIKARLAAEERKIAKFAPGKGACLCFCKGAADRKRGDAEAAVSRLQGELKQQEEKVAEMGSQAQEAQSQLQAWQGKSAELDGAQRSLESLVERMFGGGAWPRSDDLLAVTRSLEAQAAEAGSAAAKFGRGSQLLRSAEAGLQEALQALGRTQMMGALNMGRGIGFQARTGVAARRQPGRQMGNLAEMAIFRRANEGVAKAARDVAEAGALLGPGMPRVDQSILGSARAGMFQNILFGGVVSDAVQMVAVRRSMDNARTLLQQVQACLAWAQQNQGAHQQQASMLQAQAAGKRGELDEFRRQALQAAAAAN